MLIIPYNNPFFLVLFINNINEGAMERAKTQ